MKCIIDFGGKKKNDFAKITLRDDVQAVSGYATNSYFDYGIKVNKEMLNFLMKEILEDSKPRGTINPYTGEEVL